MKKLVELWGKFQVVQLVGILFLMLACPAALCLFSIVMRLTH